MLQSKRPPMGPRRNRTRLIAAVALNLILAAAHPWMAAASVHDHRHPAPLTAAREIQAPGFLITREIAANNNAGLTVFNNGFLGTNFNTRDPSFEFPLGSHIDHLVRGGIWVGGVTVEGDTLVSTSAVDGYIGDVNITSEFLPLPGTRIEMRSVLTESRYYHPDAKSQLDFRCSFADTSRTLINPQSQDPHRPLMLQVNLETLSFDFKPYDGFVIVNYEIINLSDTDPLEYVHVGLYAELASGYKDPQRPDWARGWFRKKLISYVDSLRLVSERHFTLGDGLATSWAGIQLLGTQPSPIDSMQVSFNWWNWDPSSVWSDSRRYRILSNGEIDNTSGITPGIDDPVKVLSVGPFTELLPGDTLRVSFAFVGGEEAWEQTGRTAEQDLLFNAGWAQNAYDLDFRLPSPPPSPAPLEVVPGYNHVKLRWTGELAERFIDPRDRRLDFEGYRIYISDNRVESAFRRILERDLVNSTGYDTGLDDIRTVILAPAETVLVQGPDSLETHVLPEVWQYEYTIHGLRDGFKYWVAVTAFDQGAESIGSLESGISQNRTLTVPGGPASVDGSPGVTVFPNPYHGDAAWDGNLRRDRYLWFTNLPARCVIRIYTLAGDLVDTIDFDQATYQPTDIRGIYDPTNPRDPDRDLPTLSGGMAAWDLISREDQGIASGLYIFSVDDRDTGRRQLGRFLVIK